MVYRFSENADLGSEGEWWPVERILVRHWHTVYICVRASELLLCWLRKTLLNTNIKSVLLLEFHKILIFCQPPNFILLTVSKIQRKNAFLGQNSPIPTNLFFIFLFHFLLFVKTVFTEHRGITWSFIHWILVFLSRCTSCMCWWWTCRSSNKFWV